MQQQQEGENSPINVCVTGAAGQIAYSLLYMVSKGQVFGPSQRMRLFMLDIPPMMEVLKGVEMELMDCAFPLLAEVVSTADEKVAFKDCDVAMLVGAMPRREGMERKDLLAANVKIFKSQGKSLDEVAKKTVKVVVVGNPANTNALMCSRYAPSIPKENFTALTRLDQNRAQAQIAAKCGVAVADVQNVCIWGNHSNTQFPDVSHAQVNKGGSVKSAKDGVADDNWINNEFIKTVQVRGAAVIKARKLSSAMSAAKAVCDHVRDWWSGSCEGKWVSMGVMSNGNPYEIAPDLIYSFPVRFSAPGKWEFVPGLSVSEFAREKMTTTQTELIGERDTAISVCGD